jgi:predicted XRE-type DNA-binding protein
MSLKLYESPFHAIETPKQASKSVLKTDLTIVIRDIIESQGWTQAQAAVWLGVNQPRVSDICNGRIDKFTLDALFTMLDSLGFRVQSSYDNAEQTTINIRVVSPVTAKSA